MTRYQRQKKACRGVTLIELLVAVSIMLLLAAFALPKLGPMAKQRKIREASRSVNVFLSRARSRAIETGRPCGVVFHRVTDDTTDPGKLSNAVSMLYQAEVPLPYAGNTNATAMKLQNVTTLLDKQAGRVVLQSQVQIDSLSDGLVKIGDRIQFNSQGPWYEITKSTTFPEDNGFLQFSAGTIGADPDWIDNCFLTLRWVGGPGCVVPWPSTWSASTPVSFTIQRQPVRTIAQPLTLPVGTTVDLSASGTDSDIEKPLFSKGKGDVTIMFSPNGSVGRYYWDSYDYSLGKFVPYNVDAIDPIYLLIGWREQVGRSGIEIKPADPVELDEEELPNWQILSNLWIGLNPQTGLVTVAENAHSDQAYLEAADSGPSGWESGWEAITIRASRQYARQAQMKGGR